MFRKDEALSSHLSDFVLGYLGFVDVFSGAGFETYESVNEDESLFKRKIFPLQVVNERWNPIHPFIKQLL